MQGVDSGAVIRNKFLFLSSFRKKMNTNPRRGAFYFRAPSRIIFRTIRGMIPHKTTRGKQALERLKLFEGVPPPYDRVKRMVIPDALAVTRLRPQRRTSNLGRLSSELGWKYWDLVKDLEAKRREKAAAYYQKRKALTAISVKAKKAAAGDAKVKA